MCPTTPKLSKITSNSFIDRLNGRKQMPYDEFLEWVLYDPQIGYYQNSRCRVGKFKHNDFYTSSNLGGVWGSLIVEACTNLLGENDPGLFTFVEIGAEPGSSTLDGIENPFEQVRVIRLGDTFNVPKRAIIYSNELLDAQPFKRFRYHQEAEDWLEIFVALKGDEFKEIDLERKGPLPFPPPHYPTEGYLIDWPCGSLSMMQKILYPPSWKGVFLTFDYGLDLNILMQDRPDGTARGYYRQKMNSKLLDHPGEQDLTCHLCWDILEHCLKENGFNPAIRMSQESFLLKYSTSSIQRIFRESEGPMDANMLALRELIHPAHLGHGLQGLASTRF